MFFLKQKRDSELRSDHVIRSYIWSGSNLPALWVFQNLGLGSIWSKITGLPWSHWKGGFSWLSWSGVFGSQWKTYHKSVIKVRWIRWSWIAKHWNSKSGSIWSRWDFFKNWALGSNQRPSSYQPTRSTSWATWRHCTPLTDRGCDGAHVCASS